MTMHGLTNFKLTERISGLWVVFICLTTGKTGGMLWTR